MEFGQEREGERRQEFNKRIETLASVIVNSIAVVSYSMAGLMILSEFGIDIVPILTGAGLVGLAFGFGAQNMVRDFIAGFFVLMENQYRKGDVVTIAGISGLVEDINLRRTVLRDLDGVVHFIPNGEIKTSSNLTLRFSRVNMDIPVSYATNLDHANKVLGEVGKALSRDKKFGSLITKPPEVLGVESFGENAIKIKLVCETKPMKQWDVARELRKRVKEAFDKEKIKIF